MIIKHITDRHVLLITISAILFASNVRADSVTSIAFDVGHRSDDVNFNIAGDIFGNNPNIISELTWKNLKILQARLSLEHLSSNGPVLRASTSFGSIISGSNQDSDYAGDNRTFEYSRSNNNTSGDNVFDLDAGIGYQFDIYDSASKNVAHVVPLLGYSYHVQNIRMTDGIQTLSVPALVSPVDAPPPPGPFPDLNSTYQTEWEGLWVGAQFWFRSMTGKDKFYLIFKHHWPDFYARANWNLNSDFEHPISFEHFSSGEGNEFLIKWVENTRKVWALNMTLHYQEWQVDPGVIVFHLSGGAIVSQRLNKVEWKSTAFTIGIERRI